MRIKKAIFLISCLLLFLISCTNTIDKNKLAEALKNPVKNLESYKYDPSTPLEERVRDIPDFLLDALKKWDERDDYRPYSLSGVERKIISDCMDLLPPLCSRIMKERLIGIYFVENFLGSGWTDWVFDKKGNIYCYMTFSPHVLKGDLSEIITAKEMTCYKKSDKDMKVHIDCGNKYSGFQYILIHEAVHAVDYVENITPFVEPDLQEIQKRKLSKNEFTDNVWKEYSIPVSEYEYLYRDKVTFYGFSGGPKIDIEDALDVYKGLSQTPYISIYGSKNWAEDIADFVAFYHIVKKLGQPYIINVNKGNDTVYTYEPLGSKLVSKRFKAIKVFY
jgi:uncharacterized pyridoxamine 5'-phosphate oxidase family protein